MDTVQGIGPNPEEVFCNWGDRDIKYDMDFHVSLWNQLVGLGRQHGIVEKDSGLHKARQVWVWVQILSRPLTNYDFGKLLPFVVFFLFL